VIRRLRARPLAVLLSALPIAAAVTLVLVFEGFMVGLDAQLRSLPEALPTPLLAVQPGMHNLAGTRSVLPQSARPDIEGVPGVLAAHPLLSVPLIYERDGVSTPIQVMVFDDLGGPPTLARGRMPQGKREVVADDVLALKYGIEPGDELELLGHALRVVGTSSGTGSFFAPYVFVRFDDLIDLYVESMGSGGDLLDVPLLGMLLVEVAPGESLDTVRAAIEASVPAVDLHTGAELADADQALGRRLIGPIVDLLIAVAWATGLLVAALTAFSAVAGRTREIGVLKALGFETDAIAIGLVVELGIIGAVAVALGLAGTALTTTVIGALAPQFVIEPWTLPVVGRTAIAALVVTCLGGLAPLPALVGVDPALAFRGRA